MASHGWPGMGEARRMARHGWPAADGQGQAARHGTRSDGWPGTDGQGQAARHGQPGMGEGQRENARQGKRALGVAPQASALLPDGPAMTRGSSRSWPEPMPGRPPSLLASPPGTRSSRGRVRRYRARMMIRANPRQYRQGGEDQLHLGAPSARSPREGHSCHASNTVNSGPHMQFHEAGISGNF